MPLGSMVWALRGFGYYRREWGHLGQNGCIVMEEEYLPVGIEWDPALFCGITPYMYLKSSDGCRLWHIHALEDIQ